MVTAGANEKTGGATDRNDHSGRLRLLDTNAEVYKDIIPQLHAVAPETLVLVVTDPPDSLADLVRMLGHEHVISSGTYLDSLGFRFHLGTRFGVSAAFVDAQIPGEHGTSAVFVWSSARVAGVPVVELLELTGADNREEFRQEIEGEVRFANIAIIEGIGASQHGIGMVSGCIAEIVLRGERAVIPIASYNPRYGITLSLPSILGPSGVAHIFERPLSDDERQALQHSADTLKAALVRVKL
jgi:L-lactate dehydrogenase